MKIEHTDIPIKSIDVQLVRVETCGCAEGFSKDGNFLYFKIEIPNKYYHINYFLATEIQNIQIAEGNISTGVSIPIYMIFPRLFSCATTKTANFKIGK